MTGASGQLGYALQKTLPDQHSLIALSRQEADLSDLAALQSCLALYSPDVIINAAAYTAVDKAETDQAMAHCINADAVAVIAGYCQEHTIPLVQVSTDFVFDGTRSSPYTPSEQASPLGVYGQTKYIGELSALDKCDFSYVIRTGWVYCEHGNNFVKTMLRLAAQRTELGVVADQVGTPTYAINLARMIWRLLDVRPARRIYHFSDAGVASWYDFAVAVFEEWQHRVLAFTPPHVRPISSREYPTPARRPAYSVLEKTETWTELSLEPMHWRVALRQMLDSYRALEY